MTEKLKNLTGKLIERRARQGTFEQRGRAKKNSISDNEEMRLDSLVQELSASTCPPQHAIVKAIVEEVLSQHRGFGKIAV